MEEKNFKGVDKLKYMEEQEMLLFLVLVLKD